VKRKKTGLTMIELLIVLGIIALLVGLLVPALSAVRKMAKETKQKAQLSTIELALAAFKNDEGDYPPSDTPQPGSPGSEYCGAQKLSEALLGWDLLGFHPKSAWRADGLDAAGGPGSYDPAQTRDINGNGIPDTFEERKGPYLELATIGAFRLGNISVAKPGLYIDTGPLAPDTFVLCDVFDTKKIRMANGTIARAGVPILYYKANTYGKQILDIYHMADNDGLVFVKEQADLRERPPAPGERLPRNPLAGTLTFFENYIADPKITARPWPYRPDSYILISAGADGLYGTSDDICNFGN
jgi:type II secretory pathway pseudopilin PulG